MSSLQGDVIGPIPSAYRSDEEVLPLSATAVDSSIRVMLAVLTTGSRDGTLRSCVEAISRLTPADRVEFELLIVQNGHAEITGEVARLRNEATMPLSVVIEARKGIPLARNCAIREAAARGADYLGFIDDDAEPDADWLCEAMSVLRSTGADAVGGPQAPVFPVGASARLSKASIYKAVDFDPGRPCPWAASNNVIFSIPFVQGKQLWMNETFTTGGSDKEYFRRFSHAGGVIRWAPYAVVREAVVPQRLNLGWAIRRSWRLGTSGFKIESSVMSPNRARVTCLFKGGCYLLSGLSLLPMAFVPRHPGYVDGLCHLAHGSGFIFGLSARFRPKHYA